MSSDQPIREVNEADLAEQQQAMDGAGTVTEPAAGPGEANEADVLEQQQTLGGAGSTAPAVAADEADEADALEQGTEVTTDDDGYPHEGEEL